MAITIESSRFGTVEIAPESVVEFPEGLIGLGGHRYALLARDTWQPVSVVAFAGGPERSRCPSPTRTRFFSDFSVELNDEDAARLEIDDRRRVDVYVTVRAAPVLEDFTVNLKAPILIWHGRAFR